MTLYFFSGLSILLFVLAIQSVSLRSLFAGLFLLTFYTSVILTGVLYSGELAIFLFFVGGGLYNLIKAARA